jgi:hypothetical protein
LQSDFMNLNPAGLFRPNVFSSWEEVTCPFLIYLFDMIDW